MIISSLSLPILLPAPQSVASEDPALAPVARSRPTPEFANLPALACRLLNL